MQSANISCGEKQLPETQVSYLYIKKILIKISITNVRFSQHGHSGQKPPHGKQTQK